MIRIPPVTLFWRTFLLIVCMLAIALLAWWQSIRVFEREPRAQAISNQLTSIVILTRNALLYADPQLRHELLADLADNEGIRITLREPTDQITPFPDVPLVQRITARLQTNLGATTQLANSVNDLPGIWVSFAIADDTYWVVLDRNLIVRELNRQWTGWALAALLISLLAAIAITRALIQPLRQLISSARAIGAGRTPEPLPDTGPVEIRTVNQSFNHMVANLAQMEQDRAVLLAGISHDLRTPLTRLRLELEMSPLPPDTQHAMVADIEQMDAIVRQFLDYARSTPQSPVESIDLSALVRHAVTRCRLDTLPDVSLKLDVTPGLVIEGHPTELARAVDNLLTNALRYGRNEAGQLTVEVRCQREGQAAVISVADQGAGIPPDSMERVLRPFERGDVARSGSTGAGLGLAIVERIARQHGGRFELSANTPRGLRATLRFYNAH